MIAKPTATWDDLDDSLEGIPGDNLYANGALPAAHQSQKRYLWKDITLTRSSL
jgi:hypothetical protein